MTIKTQNRRIALIPIVFLASAAAALGAVAIESGGDPGTNRAGIAVPNPTRGPAAAPGAQVTDIVRFKNGDTLHGDLLSVAPDTGLRWRHADARDVLTFSLANLAEIKFGRHSAEVKQPSTRAVARLTNGDELDGEIVSLSKDNLVLNTAYAGQITLKRVMVAGITPNLGSTSTVYSGPTGLDGWMSRGGNEGAWKYRKGTFYSVSDGNLYRDVKLPDAARIEFDAAWRRYPSLWFSFYSESGEDYYGNGYVLQINGTSVYLQRGSARRGLNNFGNNVNVESFQRKTRAHFTILVSKPKKNITLLIDNEMVKQWSDPDEFAGRGTGIMIYAQSGQGSQRISQIRITEWDGKLDSDNTPATVAREDLVRFTNNDKVSGALETIAKNEISFVTSYATLKVPLERAAQISLAGEKAEKARRQTSDVRAYFADGGRVTVALEKLDEKGLTGSSENFGRLTFAVDAFSRLQFRIYEEAGEPATEDDWGE